ncbi:hypothetical protein SAMN05216588_102293 [Pseudomonas flavescens]|uniref:Uncharacterized protein n=1 Tax=Phytopseudomonas flavescens TaxID=29435 RepID=A0A1G7ZCG1_9GAMM|nr:hypothetical protein [Pseudomonas flavescens]SDH06432.1 hypothetical protein SAMN05216588_102293 [Pseudomonas flavescens]
MNQLPEVLRSSEGKPRISAVRDALFALLPGQVDEAAAGHLAALYQRSKQLDVRRQILRLLYDLDFPVLDRFFAEAFGKERYLDMKLYALRGLARRADEGQLQTLLEGFRQALSKRQQSTPYNYQEYELLRGRNALPYLVERYGYACLRDTLEQVEAQYQAMPEAFKGHFTVDEEGTLVTLREPAAGRALIRQFFDSQGGPA